MKYRFPAILVFAATVPFAAHGQVGQVGGTVNAGSGAVGQRQTRDEAAPNIRPLGRIESRVANRVQSRIQNRIDRYYDPQANATSPFEVAGDQARIAGRRRR